MYQIYWGSWLKNKIKSSSILFNYNNFGEVYVDNEKSAKASVNEKVAFIGNIINGSDSFNMFQTEYVNRPTLETFLSGDDTVYNLSFDGTSNYFNTNYTNTNIRDISAYVRVDRSYTGQMVIAGSKNATNNNNSYIMIEKIAGVDNFTAKFGSATLSIPIATYLDVKTDIFLSAKYDGAEISLFVNSNLVASVAHSGSSVNGITSCVGCLNSNGTPSLYFKGGIISLLDVAFVLNAEERKYVYNLLTNKHDFYNNMKYLATGSNNPEDLYTEQVGFMYTSNVDLVYVLPNTTEKSIYGQTIGKLYDIHGGMYVDNNGLNATQQTLSKRPVYGREPVSGRRNYFNFSNRLSQSPWNVTNSTISLNTTENFNNKDIYNLEMTTPYNGQHYMEQNISINSNGQRTISIYVNPVNSNTLSNNFSIIVTYSNILGTQYVCQARFNILANTISNQVNCVGNINPVVDGWYRISINHNSIGSDFNIANVKFGYVGSVVSNNSRVIVSMPQYEFGAATTSYQDVINNSYIADANSRSYNYIRFDGVDDKMVTNINSELMGMPGTVFAFGKNGGVIYPYIMTENIFEFGHTTFTGGPLNLINTIGDVFGYGFINKTLTEQDIQLLIRYFGMLGAGGNVTIY